MHFRRIPTTEDDYNWDVSKNPDEIVSVNVTWEAWDMDDVTVNVEPMTGEVWTHTIDTMPEPKKEDGTGGVEGVVSSVKATVSDADGITTYSYDGIPVSTYNETVPWPTTFPQFNSTQSFAEIPESWKESDGIRDGKPTDAQHFIYHIEGLVAGHEISPEFLKWKKENI